MKSVPGFWQDTWDDATVVQGIRVSDGLAFVWAQDDEVIGFICAHDVGFRGYISELVIAEKARGLGIGTQLVQQVEQELVRRGRTMLIADVWHGAESFYRALGFGEPDVVLLRKHLSARRTAPVR
jgi:ribosomal protein S18 acetylase RimI-like enzyme